MAVVMEQEFFLSEILGRRVFVKKNRVGRLSDLAIVETGKLPEVTQLVVSRPFGDAQLTVPWDRVRLISNEEIVLDIGEDLVQFERAPQEHLILLKDHILDKKILDLDDHEVEIVYDVKLAFQNDKLYAAQNSFNSATTLTTTGLPTGVTAAFSSNPVTPPANGSATSTLTFTASASATVGTATVTVTGTSGSLVHSTTIALTVSSSTGLQTATYNATLKAPACSGVGIGCDSGPSLLLGRDTLSGGNEPNQPNTINSSCADCTSGTFHSDESNDRLTIQTTDGSTLAPGKTIKVSATVWAYSSFTSDHLD